MEINEQARTELLNQVDGLSDEDINSKPSADKWSIKQIMEHLYLMEGAITKTIKDQLVSGAIEHVENKPIERSVNRDVKAEAPDFTIPGDDFLKLDDLKQRLAGTHEGLKELVNETDEEKLKARAYPHPAFGKVSLSQWIPFVGYHEMRHIEQIKEVKQALHL